MNDAELLGYRWLISSEARPWLDEVGRHASVSPALMARLRDVLEPEQARLVVELCQLRRRARSKFSQAERMYFTRRSLEQATGEVLANYKALSFAERRRVADLCSGMGGDLLAIARRCPAVGYDREPLMTLVADANLRALGHDDGTAVTQDVTHADLSSFDAWHADPDRRSGDRRTTSVARQQPDDRVLELLLAQCPHAMIKLAPAARGLDRWDHIAEREWLGHARECQQLVVRFGSIARYPGRRTATVIGEDAGQFETIVERDGKPVVPTAPMGQVLVEPHAAVRAAGLVADYAYDRHMAFVSSGSTWLVADQPVLDQLSSSFIVQDVLPLDRKRVREYLRRHDYRPIEVKSRQREAPPERLLRELAQPIGRAVSLLVLRLDNRLRVVVAVKWPTDVAHFTSPPRVLAATCDIRYGERRSPGNLPGPYRRYG